MRLRHTRACRVLGGWLKKKLGIVTRILGEGRGILACRVLGGRFKK